MPKLFRGRLRCAAAPPRAPAARCCGGAPAHYRLRLLFADLRAAPDRPRPADFLAAAAFELRFEVRSAVDRTFVAPDSLPPLPAAAARFVFARLFFVAAFIVR